jgi:uncharacterized protein YlxP (DUF503 family)
VAFVCLIELNAHLPDGADLKGKRKQLQSLRANLQQRFGAAVAETAHQDLWQRTTLTLALVGGDQSALRERADALQRYADARLGDMTRWDRRMLTTAELLDE